MVVVIFYFKINDTGSFYLKEVLPGEELQKQGTQQSLANFCC